MDAATPPPEHCSFTRASLTLLRRAAREDWGVPDSLKTEAILACARILAAEKGARAQVAAMRLLTTMERNDLAAAKLELERAKQAQPAEGHVRDVWDELLGEPGA